MTSATLIGVMMAVALLPPLVTFGLLLGGGHPALAMGALSLFLMNLICVNLAGVTTFLVQGIHPATWGRKIAPPKARALPSAVGGVVGGIGRHDSAVAKGLNMNAQDLIDTARTLVAGDKGLLAMDESNPTCNKRFAKLGIPQTEEARRVYRELIVTTPGLAESIRGAILYDETISPAEEGWDSLCESAHRCGNHSRHQS